MGVEEVDIYKLFITASGTDKRTLKTLWQSGVMCRAKKYPDATREVWGHVQGREGLDATGEVWGHVQGKKVPRCHRGGLGTRAGQRRTRMSINLQWLPGVRGVESGWNSEEIQMYL